MQIRIKRNLEKLSGTNRQTVKRKKIDNWQQGNSSPDYSPTVPPSIFNSNHYSN